MEVESVAAKFRRAFDLPRSSRLARKFTKTAFASEPLAAMKCEKKCDALGDALIFARSPLGGLHTEKKRLYYLLLVPLLTSYYLPCPSCYLMLTTYYLPLAT